MEKFFALNDAELNMVSGGIQETAVTACPSCTYSDIREIMDLVNGSWTKVKVCRNCRHAFYINEFGEAVDLGPWRR